MSKAGGRTLPAFTARARKPESLALRPAKPAGGSAGEVRIIAGQWKRSKLRVTAVPGLRPTPDRARETLFNWLGPDLSGWRVLDAFAGTGALGFEAASRGASEVTMLERDALAAQELRAAHARLRAPGHVHIVQTDALAWMARCPAPAFDLVFLDPPFDAGLVPEALGFAAGLLAPGGLIMVEGPEYLASPLPKGLQLKKAQKVGAAHIQILQVDDAISI